MAGILGTIIEHRLNIKPEFSPAKQKKRLMAKDKNKIINKKVEDLLQAGVVRETKFPKWIDNPVLVRKGE